MNDSLRVVVTANAKRNLRDYYLYAADRAPETAKKWLERFEHAITSLASNPERCGIAPESTLVAREVRQLLFGSGHSVFRALFVVTADEVQVLHVRRATMDVAMPDELFE